MLKKPKNLDRRLKSWGIVENGLYFENIKKKKNKKINIRVQKRRRWKNDIDFLRDIDFRRPLYVVLVPVLSSSLTCLLDTAMECRTVCR